MKNVYQIGSGDLTFEIIERIINEKALCFSYRT